MTSIRRFGRAIPSSSGGGHLRKWGGLVHIVPGRGQGIDGMRITNRIATIAKSAAEWRQGLHARPELGYREHETARTVANSLERFGFDEIRTGIGGTGVVGVLHGRSGAGSGESDAVMLRSDMDALPIREETGLPHASKNEGVMHACGHDGHMAMLLGAAASLAETRAFDGTAYFCFQPAEEGGAGADAMMRDGLFERFPCRAVFGMHNWPGMAAGEFGIRTGPIFAAADLFEIAIAGRGGHAAQPERTVDPVFAGAAVVQALQSVVARNSDPFQPAVVSVTKFQAGDACNVIPDGALLGGTLRSFDDEAFEAMYGRIEVIATGVAGALGASAELRRSTAAYPAAVNDSATTAFAGDVVEDLGGRIDRSCRQTMGGEDFAFLAREKPAAFMLIGAGEEHPRLHTSRYDFNDAILPQGIAYWVGLVERALPARD